MKIVIKVLKNLHQNHNKKKMWQTKSNKWMKRKEIRNNKINKPIIRNNKTDTNQQKVPPTVQINLMRSKKNLSNMVPKITYRINNNNRMCKMDKIS